MAKSLFRKDRFSVDISVHNSEGMTAMKSQGVEKASRVVINLALHGISVRVAPLNGDWRYLQRPSPPIRHSYGRISEFNTGASFSLLRAFRDI